MIEVHEVSKSYGELRALDGVSFRVAPGSSLGLVGPNGAGKSTLLRIVCGLARPDEGRVLLAGEDVVHEYATRRNVGCVPEVLPLFELLTGNEQLRWTGAALGLDGDVAENRLVELARALELEGALSRRISTFSTGMKKKLAFAAALMGDPRILILDEPFEGVDLLGIATMKDILTQFVEAGAVLLVSSHILPLLEDVCSDFVLLHHGRVVLKGNRAALRVRAQEIAGRNDGDDRTDLESVFLDIVAPGRRARRLATLAGGINA